MAGSHTAVRLTLDRMGRISHRDFFNLTVQICATYQRGEERSESAGGISDAPILMPYTRKHHANTRTFLSMSTCRISTHERAAKTSELPPPHGSRGAPAAPQRPRVTSVSAHLRGKAVKGVRARFRVEIVIRTDCERARGRWSADHYKATWGRARVIKGTFGRRSAIDARMQWEWARTVRSWK